MYSNHSRHERQANPLLIPIKSIDFAATLKQYLLKNTSQVSGFSSTLQLHAMSLGAQCHSAAHTALKTVHV